MAASPFEVFVGIEMPTRISSKDDPVLVKKDMIPVTTGAGLQTEFKPLAELAAPGEKGEKGEKGDQGPVGVLHVMGYLESVDQLPAPTGFMEGDAYFIDKRIHVIYNGAWADAGDISGPIGASAYDIAVAQGFEGELSDWLASLKGIDGLGLRILGSFPSVDFLPMDDNESGDCYVIEYKMWVWDTVTWTPVGQVGPAGMSAYQAAVQGGFSGSQTAWLKTLVGKSAYQSAKDQGFVGTEAAWLTSIIGPQGLKGDKGDKGDIGLTGSAAAVVVLKGTKADVPSLPTGAAVSDGWLVNNDLYVWTGLSWQNIGKIVGPKGDQGIKGDKGDKGDQGIQGKSNYDIAVAKGFVGTEAAWLLTQVGEQGQSAYEIAVSKGFTGAIADWLLSLKGVAGEKGIKGDTGAQGAGLVVKGKVADVASLPAGALDNECYVVDRNLYLRLAGAWVDLGLFAGAKGDVGPKGDQGIKGDKGDKGDSVKGDQGIKGDKGDTGTKGDVGPKGDKGDTGVGEKGDIGPKGDKGDTGETGRSGAGINLLGKFATVAGLPATGTLGTGYLIGLDFWGWTGTAWDNFGPLKGDKGDKGDVGPKGETGVGVKGDKGDTGAKGDIGPALTMKGKLNSTAELPASGALGDGYLIAGDFWGWAGTAYQNFGPVQGPKGDIGTAGIKGDKGDKGDIGAGLLVKGTLADEAALTAVVSPVVGWCYFVKNHLRVWNGTVWKDLGDLTGPVGKSALQIAQEIDPTITNATLFMAALAGAKGDKGDKGDIGLTGGSFKPKGYLATDAERLALTGMAAGDTYIVGAGLVWAYDTAWVNLGSIQGPKGPQGAMGPGITILGKLANQAALPATGTLGQGYIIDLNFWGWTGTAFENLGPVQGPKGDKGDSVVGPKGEQGIKGDIGGTGLKGDTGTLWLVLGRDPGPIDGRKGDYFLNSSTLQFFKKVSDVLWGPLGYMGGGNVYDAPYDDEQYARYNGAWKIISVLEAPKDGKRYVRVDGGWAELVIAVTEAPKDGKTYLRKDAAWVAFDKAFDKYDVKIVAALTELDLSVSQVFSIANSGARTLTFKAGTVPAVGRSMTVVLIINGVGTITWPAGIIWNASTQPVLGATTTIVTLLWDGIASRWIGSTGASV